MCLLNRGNNLDMSLFALFFMPVFSVYMAIFPSFPQTAEKIWV